MNNEFRTGNLTDRLNATIAKLAGIVLAPRRVIPRILQEQQFLAPLLILIILLAILRIIMLPELLEHYDTDKFRSWYQETRKVGEVQMNKDIENQLDSVLELIRKNKDKICAIGEIGLDFHFVKDKTLYPLQEHIFNKMLSLAQELELPINLHTKGAEQIVFNTLPSFRIPNINIHWYSGPENLLKKGIDRGYYFSVTPAISYSPAVKKVAVMVDKEHLLLESDGPVKYTGKIGRPSMIREVLNLISKFKDVSADILEDQIYENTKKIFPKIF